MFGQGVNLPQKLLRFPNRGSLPRVRPRSAEWPDGEVPHHQTEASIHLTNKTTNKQIAATNEHIITYAKVGLPTSPWCWSGRPPSSSSAATSRSPTRPPPDGIFKVWTGFSKFGLDFQNLDGILDFGLLFGWISGFQSPSEAVARPALVQRSPIRPISVLRFWVSEGLIQAESYYKGWNSHVHGELISGKFRVNKA